MGFVTLPEMEAEASMDFFCFVFWERKIKNAGVGQGRRFIGSGVGPFVRVVFFILNSAL
jgi:hypothetical protein